MKSFSQFLQESYLDEAEVTYSSVTPSGRVRSPAEQQAYTDITARELAQQEAKKRRPPSGAAADPSKQFKPQQPPQEPRQLRLLRRDDKTSYDFTKNIGNKALATDPVERPRRALPPATSPLPTSPGQMEFDFNAKPNKGGPLVKTPSSTLAAPVGSQSNPIRIRTNLNVPTPGKLDTSQRRPPSVNPSKTGVSSRGGKPPSRSSLRSSSGALALRPQGASALTAPVGSQSNPIRTNLNVPTPGKPNTSQSSLPSANTTSQRRPPSVNPSSRREVLGKPPSGSSSTQTSSTSRLQQTGPRSTGRWAKIGRFAGPATAALDTALSTADERSKGSGWARSLAKGATVAAGGLAGGALGALGGGGIGSAALGTAGAIGGAELAGKAFDTVAGANARERASMAKANRQRQAGSALKGIGGKTTFDTKKNTMTTGVGSQRKTVGLAKTGVVNRGGQSTVGYLAYKGGKAVYKAAPRPETLAQTSSNAAERIFRSLPIFKDAYRTHDAKMAKQALQRARQNDAARNNALGVKARPGK